MNVYLPSIMTNPRQIGRMANHAQTWAPPSVTVTRLWEILESRRNDSCIVRGASLISAARSTFTSEAVSTALKACSMLSDLASIKTCRMLSTKSRAAWPWASGSERGARSSAELSFERPLSDIIVVRSRQAEAAGSPPSAPEIACQRYWLSTRDDRARPQLKSAAVSRISSSLYHMLGSKR